MDIESIDKDVAKELLTIISYCDDKFLQIIPNYILKKLNDLAADSEKEVYINKNKSLIEQDVSDDCKNLLAILYFTYMTDLELKNKILSMLYTN